MINKRKRVVLNAAGLHTGGGVQVATSFIDELTKINHSDIDVNILVSSEVDNNLRELGSDLCCFNDYRVFDVYGLKALFSGIGKYFEGSDVVFTIFGPTYYPILTKKRIVGFAQPWIVYPNNEVYSLIKPWSRVLLKIKYLLQGWFFTYSDRYIVELEHVRDGLVSVGLASPESIDVVYNTLPDIYSTPDKWKSLRVSMESVSGSFRIGFLGRDYLHKNLDLLPKVRELLQRVYSIDVQFFVTLADEEWACRDTEFRQAVVNVGVLSMAECPTFYSQIDGVIFPSLLECFSVTPLEAMAMGKPLFASDRRFVRDVCGEYPFYFDPLDSHSVAETIAGYLRDRVSHKTRISEAKKIAYGFSSPTKRAESYLKVIRSCMDD